MIVDLKVLLFLQVVLVVGLPLLLWGPFRLGRIFPLPIIQIFAGIVLGPSIFGALAPEAFTFFFRKDVLSGVDTLANVALVLFVFLAGCELDKQVLRKAAGTVLRVGVAGVAVPWIAGAFAAWGLLVFYHAPGLLGSLQNPVLYCISFGLCMAVTALPVLVVILRELGFNQRPIGTIALGVGGIDDALLWSALTIILPFAASSANPLMACSTAIFGAIGTIGVLHFMVSPVLQKLIDRQAQERVLISLAVVVLFAAAALNEATQLHAAIGAFLTGLLLPGKIREQCEERLDVPVTLVLLPFLFLATGLKTSFAFTDGAVWLVVLVAMLVCVGGKFLGISLPTRASGESWPFAITLGTLMQCKGLMEIVVVTVLYQKGVLGQLTFSALVLVALISTAITVPMARMCQRRFGDAATESVASEALSVSVEPAAVAKQPAKDNARLVFENRTVEITKPEVIIGRHSSDDIQINDVRVSRHHARLCRADGGYEIHNQTAVRSEPNPISINGVEKEHARITDGDRISIGGIEATFRAGAK